jgi:hypothetical protein
LPSPGRYPVTNEGRASPTPTTGERLNMILEFFKSTVDTVKSINQKYAKPQIKMTRLVKFSLLSLRLYLLFLVGILVYRFITLLR